MSFRIYHLLIPVAVAAVMLRPGSVHARNGDSAAAGLVKTTPLYSFRLSVGAFHIRNTSGPGGTVELIGARFGRQIHKRLKLELCYHVWNTALQTELAYEKGILYESESRQVAGADYRAVKGQLEQRIRYKTIDLNVTTPAVSLAGLHEVRAGLAASYCWGTNVYFENQFPLYGTHDPLMRYSRAGYAGLCPNLSYTFTTPDKMFSFGAEYLLRWYEGREKLQQDVNVMAGFNF